MVQQKAFLNVKLSGRSKVPIVSIFERTQLKILPEQVISAQGHFNLKVESRH